MFAFVISGLQPINSFTGVAIPTTCPAGPSRQAPRRAHGNDPRLPRPIEDRNKPYDGDWARLLRRLDELFRDNDNQHEKEGRQIRRNRRRWRVGFFRPNPQPEHDRHLLGVRLQILRPALKSRAYRPKVINANVLRVTFAVVATDSTRVIVSA